MATVTQRDIMMLERDVLDVGEVITRKEHEKLIEYHKEEILKTMKIKELTKGLNSRELEMMLDEEIEPHARRLVYLRSLRF